MKRDMNYKTVILVILAIVVTVYLRGGFDLHFHSDNKPEIDITYSGGMDEVNEDEIPDDYYYSTVESAMQNADIETEDGCEYQRNIDEIIETFENDNYITIYFRSIKSESEESFTMAKFKKKNINDNQKYCFLSETLNVAKKGSLIENNTRKLVVNALTMMDYMQGENIEANEKKFLWGICRDSKIYSLKIEDQKPDGIIKYNVFNREEYFWYYEDLKSDKPVDEMVVVMNED